MKKWQIIDLVRSFCIIAVLGVHYYTNVPFSNPFVCWLWGTFCVNGFYGVFLFFMISGFLITHVISENSKNIFKLNILKFYVQRAGRIWPLYFAFFFLGLFFFYILPKNAPLYSFYFTSKTNYDSWFWFSFPTFTYNWFLVFRNNWDYIGQWGILWSLAIEEQFYFLYPLLLKKADSEKRLAIGLSLIIVAAILWRILFYFHGADNSFIQSYASPGKFDLMAMGILLYLTFKRYGNYFSKNQTAGLLICGGGLVLTLTAYFGTHETNRLTEIFVPEALGLGLFGFLLGGLHLSFFESKFLYIFSLPGKYCYGSYLIHTLLLFFIRPLLAQFDLFIGFFIFVVLTTCIAAFSYHFFEMPVNRLIRKSFDVR